MALRIRRQSLLEILERRCLLSTIYVDAGVAGSTHDGTSWGTAFTDLRSALAIVNSGDQVDVAGGTYKPTSGTDRTISFNVADSVSIYGGFAGAASNDPDTRDPATYATVLSGDIGATDDNSDNSYHVVAGSNITLDGLTITGGNADAQNLSGDIGTDAGAGLLSPHGSPTVNQCVFVNNLVMGGPRNLGSDGAAITCEGGTITNCMFANDVAVENGYGTSGGAIFVLSAGAMQISNCSFTECNADYGGAIYIESSIEGPSALIDVTNCSFNGNTGTKIGGAACVTLGTVAFTNCIFVGNNSPNGGAFGVYGAGGTTDSFSNCTFASNSSAIDDMPGEEWPGASIVVRNSILFDNNSSLSVQSGASGVVTYSDVQGSYPGQGNIDADPQFIQNPAPGTDGVWGTADDNYGNLQLQQTSPCVDAGENADVPTGTTIDLAGNPRFIDVPTVPDTGLGTAPIVDMGAYETVPTIAAIPGGPYAVMQGQSITLSGSGISDIAGQFHYAWDFTGNGQYADATGAEPAYSATLQTSPGVHTIALRVTNANGQSAVATTTVNVTAATLQAVAGGPYTVIAGKNVALAGSATTNVSGSLTYAWDFSNNGQFSDASGASPIFSAANITAETTVPIELLVTDALGQTSIADATVNVMPAIIYVDAIAPGPDTGADWSHAFTNLSDALNQAVAGQTIRVAAGTYYPTNAADRTASFNLKNGVEIDGGYAGYGATDPDSRRLDPNYTILSGNIGDTSTNTDNSYNVVTGNGVDATAVLDGITIREGHANGSDSQGQGGGIYLDNASPTIENCFVYDNFASSGGGIYASNSSPALTDCIIENNTSSNGGAGIFSESSSPTISGCQFSNNNVSGSGSGGAMANEDSSTPVVTDSSFGGNHAANGGAVYNANSNPEYSYCIFTGNAATNAGGAIYNSGSSPSLTNCDLTGNKGSTLAGAMDDDNSTPLVTNSILWNNWTNASASEIADTSSTPTITYSDIQGGYFGTGNINADPKFAAAATPGPDGIWGTYDDYYGKLELMPGSPCIGTANATAGSADMGRYAFSASPEVTATNLLPDAVTPKQKFQLTATVIASTATDPVKSVSVYYDTNSDGSYDAGDMLLGNAKKTKKGWVFNVHADKTLSGTSCCFIVAQSQSGQTSDLREWLNVNNDPAPTITKLAAEVNVKKSLGLFQIKGTGSAKSVKRVVIVEDTDGNGILDADDETLYDGNGRSLTKPWNIQSPGATGYLFFVQVENTDGKWSQISDTSAHSV